MVACGSLEHIFEKHLPENPTLLESLSSWKQMKSMKPIDDSSFTEIFGELHFKENHHVHVSPESSSPSSSSLLQSSPASSLSFSSTFLTGIDNPRSDKNGSSSIYQDKSSIFTSTYYPSIPKKQYKHSDSFSSMNSESLSICTEGLGFESFDDVDDSLSNDIICNNHWKHQEERESFTRNITPTDQNHGGELKIARTTKEAFPPPISCIGRSGKPWVCFKSYRQDGRFILKEIRIPTQESLHACRQNGRLKLQFIQSDDEILEEDEENMEEINEDIGKNGDDYDYIPEHDRIAGDEEENGEEHVETGNCNVHGVS